MEITPEGERTRIPNQAIFPLTPRTGEWNRLEHRHSSPTNACQSAKNLTLSVSVIILPVDAFGNPINGLERLMENIGFGIFPMFFSIIWLLFILGGAVGVILFIIAVWRAMLAHEDMARSLKMMAERSRES
jgi:hypothetical protein